MSSLLDGIHVHATVNVYLASQPEVAEIQQSLRTITGIVTALRSQGVQLMSKADDIGTVLDQINEATNTSAGKLDEVSADVDDLIAQLAGGVSPTDAAAIITRLQGTKAVLDSQSAFLTAIAAKHDTPVPPPVEPPAEPPAEPAGV